ncbi:hypothetical protein IHN63_00560 [Deinococcus sp. 6YEL10]|uniref:hypothetical protein n=1 Tax=Deinococcus sp. 6YEL10 TaxID=2745870 RepID=UPI001E307574|nr:hypothetical protein [Deinococcus sp. 6YEL10]MCD0159791.1 hypothetical protein [Deinococcus sp. 6YEL10]
MKHGYYKKTSGHKDRPAEDLPDIRKAGNDALRTDKSFLNRATKQLSGLGPIGTPDEAEMEIIRRFLPDPEVTADELFVWPVMMANDLEDRHIQRFDRRTLQDFVNLPEAKGVVGKSLIVAHGASLFNRDGSGVPEGRIYQAEVVQDPDNINPITQEPTNWLVGRVYMARTDDMKDTIAKIRAGVLAFVSVGVIVEEEIDPNTGKAWGWDYYQSDDGTVRREHTGVSILRGAREFVELSYKITLGAQYGAAAGGSYKSLEQERPEPERPQPKETNMQKFKVNGQEIEVDEATHAALTALAEKASQTEALSAKVAAAETRVSEITAQLSAVEAAKSAAEAAHVEVTGKLEAATKEIGTIKDALLDRLEIEAVAAGEDEDGARELRELYQDKSLEQITKRVERLSSRKSGLPSGRHSEPTDGDKQTEDAAVSKERGSSIANTIFGKTYQ